VPTKSGREREEAFAAVESAASALPGVVRARKYDGSPVLQLDGCFVAGLAMHRSAEPDTLVVRMTVEDRALFLADAPDIYYVTAYYEPYPVVLVRLARIDRDALGELIAISWRLTSTKTRKKGRSNARRSGSGRGSPLPPRQH